MKKLPYPCRVNPPQFWGKILKTKGGYANKRWLWSWSWSHTPVFGKYVHQSTSWSSSQYNYMDYAEWLK